MKKLKYAMIGCGGIANSKHLNALASVEDLVEIVAVCDIKLEKAKLTAKHFGLKEDKIFTDYKKLLELEEIDVVMVLTPNISHSFISIDAMEAGKHVICEKPMAINSIEAKKMVDAAKKTGKLLTIAYQNRYRQDSLYLKQLCENNELGEIYYAKAHAVRRKAVPTWGVFTDKDKQGGGPLIDIGTHALDLTLWNLDNYKPKMVVGSVYKKLSDNVDGNIFGKWDINSIDVEDSAMGYLIMEDGTTVYIEASWALNTRDIKEAKCTLHGTLAGADMENGLTINDAKYGKLREINIDLAENSIPFFEGHNFTEEAIEARVFANAILEGTELVVKPEQAYTVTRILEAIYESAKSGKPIFLNS